MRIFNFLRASYLIEVLRSNDSLSNPQLLLQLLDALAESAHDDIYVALPGDAQKVPSPQLHREMPAGGVHLSSRN